MIGFCLLCIRDRDEKRRVRICSCRPSGFVANGTAPAGVGAECERDQRDIRLLRQQQFVSMRMRVRVRMCCGCDEGAGGVGAEDGCVLLTRINNQRCPNNTSNMLSMERTWSDDEIHDYEILLIICFCMTVGGWG